MSKIDPDFEYEGDIESPPAVLSSGNIVTEVAVNVEDTWKTCCASGRLMRRWTAPPRRNRRLARRGAWKLVCNLMIDQKKSSEGEARRVLGQLDQLSADLQDASAEEIKGRKQVAEALARPRGTEAGRLARAMALEQAAKNSVSAPLRIARNSMEILELLNELTEIGNPIVFAESLRALNWR